MKSTVSLLEQKIASFQAFPSNVIGAAVKQFYDRAVSPYIQQRTAKAAAIKKLPSDQQNAAYAQFRAWRDEHDQPVTVTQGGQTSTFPSPVQVGLLRLPPDQLHAYLAGSVAGRWQDIASYEKTLLGVPTSKGVSEGWSGYQQAISAYHKANPGSTIVLAPRAGLATQIDKVDPGFAKDWQLSQTPKVVRFQQTNLYQTMAPAVRQLFDANIAGPRETDRRRDQTERPRHLLHRRVAQIHRRPRHAELA